MRHATTILTGKRFERIGSVSAVHMQVGMRSRVPSLETLHTNRLLPRADWEALSKCPYRPIASNNHSYRMSRSRHNLAQDWEATKTRHAGRLALISNHCV